MTDLERECAAVDELLRALGLDPEQCRTDGGAINMARTRTLLSERAPGDISEKLDELADLCEHWKRHRERGRTPGAIRAGLLMLVQECAVLTVSAGGPPQTSAPTSGIGADQDLLELAAKAVNGGSWHPLTHATPGRNEWNPLADDGDALRLAVMLRLQVTPGTYNQTEATAYLNANAEAHEYVHFLQDLAAATRRAIVRAAAKMVNAEIQGRP